MYVTRAHHVGLAPFLRGLRLTIEPVLAFIVLAPLVQDLRLRYSGKLHTHSHTSWLILAERSSELRRGRRDRSVNEDRLIPRFVIHGDNASKRPRTDS